ncbi:AzlD domain-containing protein [Cupriavidus necator]|uniref:AzlD domain-containing protein n=1 Tax=Cupriavidus necator TaxID=106590 RepID=UPI00339D84F5
MDEANLYLKLLALGAVIYLIRAVPLLFLSRSELPGAVKLWLEYLTPSILAAMISPSLLVAADGGRLSQVSLPHLMGLLVTGAVFYFSRKRILSLLLGVIAFYFVHVRVG